MESLLTAAFKGTMAVEYVYSIGGALIDRVKLKYSGKMLSQCHSVHHRFLSTLGLGFPRIDLGPPC
jgi:hypothetical protein